MGCQTQVSDVSSVSASHHGILLLSLVEIMDYGQNLEKLKSESRISWLVGEYVALERVRSQYHQKGDITKGFVS